ncbi:RluA family pseudouridine synthase [Virgibacillus oceani]
MEWVIDKAHDGMMIRDYLQSVHGFSQRIIKAVKFDGGHITVNASSVTVRYRLTSGDRLNVQFPPEKKGAHMLPEDLDLHIVYEDMDILVIDKQPGIPVIPSFQHLTGTVANAVLGHYEKKQIPFTIHTVTRLDRDTSGLMLIAKHRYSHSILAGFQKSGSIKRSYQAIIEGRLSEKEGTIDLPIGREEGSIIERAVTANGKSAVTHYKVIQDFFDCALIQVQLETGRTHQIRVHFSHLGHPLLGDTLYGGKAGQMNRQALHCDEISFPHPATKNIVRFESSLPNDMEKVIKSKP